MLNVTSRLFAVIAAIGAALVTGSAAAHDLGLAESLAQGLAHPMLGIDHVLAMLAVGLWAARQGGAATWRLPAAFLAAVAAGTAMGAFGIPVPAVEFGIAGSVLFLGLAVAASWRFSPAAGVTIAAIFALFHGHAHGSEMIEPSLAYAAGFMLTTALLHGVGLGAGLLARRWTSIAGGAIALAGFGLLLSL